MLSALHELEGFSTLAILICVLMVLLLIKEIREIVKYFRTWANEKEVASLSQNEINVLTQENHESIKKLEGSVKDLQGKFDSISEQLKGLKEDGRNNKRAELKDRIGQGFRFYSKRRYSDEQPIPYWNEMERDAFEDLISSYEYNGGENSFVHTTVANIIPTWIIVPYDYVEK